MGRYVNVWSVCLLLGFMSVACCDSLDGIEDLRRDLPVPSVSPFSREAVDPSTLDDFRKTYGVGFSYDAIYGERCNLKDVRCQVLDYAKLKTWERDNSIPLLLTNVESHVTTTWDLSYSKSEFAHKTQFHAGVGVNLVMFKGEVQGGFMVWESGVRHNLYCQAKYSTSLFSVMLDAPSVKVLVVDRGTTDFLSENFKEAVGWMRKYKDSPNKEAVADSFLVRYGTHVVTSADLGGSLTATMALESDTLLDVMSKELLTDVDILNVFRNKSETQEEEKVLYVFNDADCSLEIKGGDLSCVPNEMLHFKMGNQAENLAEYIADWRNSISYDAKNYVDSNLEMTDMQVSPIWNFIPDADVAALVKSRVESKSAEMTNMYGYQNVVNTSFRLPERVTCQMGTKEQTFENPDVVNIIAAGRYVATVCRERIEGINPDKEVQVVYPIHDRRINLKNGLCIDDMKAYRIRWDKKGCTVEEIGTVESDGLVYLNGGFPDVVRYQNVDYLDSYSVIGYEWPGSISLDGTLNEKLPYYLVYKKNTDFFLRNMNGEEQQGKLEALPNWEFNGSRMIRTKDYHYYWNPLEVGY